MLNELRQRNLCSEFYIRKNTEVFAVLYIVYIIVVYNVATRDECAPTGALDIAEI